MKPAQTVKQFVLKAVGKNKDKKQPVKDDRASFDQDCETLRIWYGDLRLRLIVNGIETPPGDGG
ncbi:hypothetical protein AGABI1DRAFT_97191 [Agaricus bisporus var. burnettii JB137-S8]|uniref:Uncharacterized protein n=1 Tax=Agaricus bisporus var. burnettii (strain JB137-S8 / ATCC MYA-4627 / FGSC 10392) TaxID=597362 RepID=K5XL30_AGABU|nr:uncharacterized protein AGABI1DRAFT_97191 [Agaricus bisporus var. burnettii JB137-S8]EKM84268.1 hypothetical protein AGABI1DRAFT_97191 [Agaricus bisporus var. burnettii JB137-S8]